jgi:hypothetical protein
VDIRDRAFERRAIAVMISTTEKSPLMTAYGSLDPP